MAERYLVQDIADFALRVGDADLRDEARARLKLSLLDTLGCAVGALGHGPVTAIRSFVDEFGGSGRSTLIGGGHGAPDRATLLNGCLVRYLDFMDNAAAPGEVCHPADNIAAMLALAEHVDASGRDLLLAIAVAYQVQARLIEIAPTMRAGINYTTPLAFSVAAGAARLLGLDATQAFNALALAGVGGVSLAVIQAEPVSQWKGLASGEVAARAVQNSLLAARGITGTIGVFEGPFGLDHIAPGRKPHDWSRETLDAGQRVSIKRYNAEFQSQSAVDAAIGLHEDGLDTARISGVTLRVATGAYNVIGGGTYGPKDACHDKEQADHNLRYLIAVALLDGAVGPAQFTPDRINRADVQALLRRVTVEPDDGFAARIPGEMPAHLTVTSGSDVSEVDRTDYPGFHTRPMSQAEVVAKFDALTGTRLDRGLRDEIVAAVDGIEQLRASALGAMLARAASG